MNILLREETSQHNLHLLREEAAKYNLHLEVYDVSDLITMAAEDRFEYCADEMDWLQEDNHQIFGINFQEILRNAPELYYTESSLARLISEKVLKNTSYDAPRALMSLSRGKLFICHVPPVHQEIRKFLDSLRQLAQIPIHIDLQYIICKNNFFRQVEMAFTPLYLQNDHGASLMLYSHLSLDQEQQLFAAIAKSKDAAVCFKKSFVARHMETRYVSHAYRTHFVAGYDYLKKTDRIGRMYEGTISKIRPQLHPEEQEISLELTLDVAVLTKPLQALPVAEGEIALPTQLTQHIQTQLTIPYKKSLLLAGCANPYEDEGEKSFAPSRKKEHLLLYWNVQMP